MPPPSSPSSMYLKTANVSSLFLFSVSHTSPSLLSPLLSSFPSPPPPPLPLQNHRCLSWTCLCQCLPAHSPSHDTCTGVWEEVPAGWGQSSEVGTDPGTATLRLKWPQKGCSWTHCLLEDLSQEMPRVGGAWEHSDQKLACWEAGRDSSEGGGQAR